MQAGRRAWCSCSYTWNKDENKRDSYKSRFYYTYSIFAFIL